MKKKETQVELWRVGRKNETWCERRAGREAEGGESGGGISDQVSRSAVEVWGFLTGVAFSITWLCNLTDERNAAAPPNL